MTDQELRRAVLDALAEVAPEADLDTLEPDVDLREQIDIDSMDLLNLVIGIHDRTGVDVPEKDYPKLVTLDGSIRYLRARLGSAARSG